MDMSIYYLYMINSLFYPPSVNELDYNTSNLKVYKIKNVLS